MYHCLKLAKHVAIINKYNIMLHVVAVWTGFQRLCSVQCSIPSSSGVRYRDKDTSTNEGCDRPLQQHRVFLCIVIFLLNVR
jgi:hypothetical protein